MDHRLFLSAVIFMGKTGSWWKHLPSIYGNHKTIHSRFTHWAKRGVFECFFKKLVEGGGRGVLRFIDSAFVKCSICATTGKCSEKQRVVGKTKGGWNTKVFAVCDTGKKVCHVQIAPGNESEHKTAERLDFNVQNLKIVGDKGFSSKKLRSWLESLGAKHCIAQKSNEKNKAAFNKGDYKRRHNIENVFSWMRRWTRLELRRERLPLNFFGFVYLWSISTWIKF